MSGSDTISRRKKNSNQIKASPYVVMDIKVTHIIEHTPAWHKLQERIIKAEDEIEAQKALLHV